MAYLFVYCGLIGAFVQGGAIGRLVKRLGEPKLIAVSLVLTGISLAMLPFIGGTAELSWSVLFRAEGRPWLAMLGALALLSIGSSLTRPPLFGLLSNLTAAHEQGANIGVAQGAGSLARILGPIFATGLLPINRRSPIWCARECCSARPLCWCSASGSDIEAPPPRSSQQSRRLTSKKAPPPCRQNEVRAASVESDPDASWQALGRQLLHSDDPGFPQIVTGDLAKLFKRPTRDHSQAERGSFARRATSDNCSWIRTRDHRSRCARSRASCWRDF